MNKYRPETDEERRKRIVAAAAQKAKEGEKAQPQTTTDRNQVVQYGLNNVTALVEQKKAKLVVIAHDVEPIEVCFIFDAFLLFGDTIQYPIRCIIIGFYFNCVACSLAPFSLQKDGRSLRYCERKGQIGCCCSQEERCCCCPHKR